MMSWQTWPPPVGWPANAPSIRWQTLAVQHSPDDTGQPRHAISLWLFKLDGTEPDASPLTDCLNEGEQARAARFRLPLHARRHRVAHAVMRQLIGHLITQPAAALAWQTGPHGKPGLSPSGARGSALHFNLSHSGAWALLATSPTLEVGVDIEEQSSRPHLAGMVSRIFSPEELKARPSETPAPTAADELLLAWVRKEACLKALGVGLSQEMSSLTLNASGKQGQATLNVVAQPVHWSDLSLPADCPHQACGAWLLGHQTSAGKRKV